MGAIHSRPEREAGPPASMNKSQLLQAAVLLDEEMFQCAVWDDPDSLAPYMTRRQEIVDQLQQLDARGAAPRCSLPSALLARFREIEQQIEDALLRGKTEIARELDELRRRAPGHRGYHPKLDIAAHFVDHRQ